MPIKILMPALSPTMEKGNLARWLKKEGDKIKPGDVIAEIETDKATMEVEAVDEGTLAKILVPAGTQDVPVNQPIAIIASEGEDPATVKSTGGANLPGHVDQGGVAAEPVAAPISAPAIVESVAEAYDSSAEIPAGAGLVSMTMREALRDAMAEEMRRDDAVFVMGEEVAEYQGAYKVTQGLLQEFGARRVIDTPITEHGFAGVGVGAAFAGLKPIVESMTLTSRCRRSITSSIRRPRHFICQAAKWVVRSCFVARTGLPRVLPRNIRRIIRRGTRTCQGSRLSLRRTRSMRRAC